MRHAVGAIRHGCTHFVVEQRAFAPAIRAFVAPRLSEVSRVSRMLSTTRDFEKRIEQ